MTDDKHPNNLRLKSSLFPFIKHCRCFFESGQITNWQILLEKTFCNLISANCAAVLPLTRRARRSISKWLTKSLPQTHLSDCSSWWKGGRGAWCSGRNRTCFFGSSFAAAAIEGGRNRLLYMYSRNVGLRPTVWQVGRGGRSPYSGNCQSLISIFQSGKFRNVNLKIGYPVHWSVIVPWYHLPPRRMMHAEFALMKLSFKSKSDPNVYIWCSLG